MTLRSPLPRVPVPLREGDQDVLLALQPLIESGCADGGHDDIDYRVPADPPLDVDDESYADGLLRDCGRR